MSRTCGLTSTVRYRDAMRPRARLALSALALSLLSLGCFCGDGASPARAECESADTGAMVDSIELNAFHSSGAQGLQMIMFDVTFRGPSPPSCAAISYTLDGGSAGAGMVLIETMEVAGGAQTREPHWELWEFGDAVDVRVQAYGQTASAHVCQYSDCGDGGS